MSECGGSARAVSICNDAVILNNDTAESVALADLCHSFESEKEILTVSALPS